MKTRRQSREIVFALLFEWSFKPTSQMDEIVENCFEAREIVLDNFSKEILYRTVENIDNLDSTIEKYSKGWKINRISKVSLAILRMSLCEIFYFDDIPVGASINEAVELVKKYGSEDESSFLNGILGSVARSGDVKKSINPEDEESIAALEDGEEKKE